MKLSATRDAVFTPPPLLGQHTDEVLQDLLKLEGREVQALRAAGVIG